MIRIYSLLLGLGAAALSACSTPDDMALRAMPVQERHPISVEPRIVELRLVSGPQGLSDGERARLGGFLKDYATTSDGAIMIATPDGSPNKTASVKSAADARALIELAGIPGNRVRMGAYPAAAGDGGAPVVVSYVAYVAAGPKCGDFASDLANTSQNQVSPNFGCATQANYAAMIADPRDLLMPRPETPGDARRRMIVLEKYRNGEPTATTRTQDESGAVSTVAR